MTSITITKQTVQTGIFAFVGITFAIYLYSVVEHDDGVGKVCLILLACLGLTMPIVLLNLNYDTDRKFSDEAKEIKDLSSTIDKLMKEASDVNKTLYLLQSLKKALLKTRDPNATDYLDGFQHFQLGIVQCVYSVLQTCEMMDDKRIVIGLEIISLLFEDEYVRNQVFREQEFARYCVDEHSQLLFRLLPVGLMQGEAIRTTLVIKAITVLTLMTINDPVIQDRFADRGIITWILGSCFQNLNGDSKSLINVGIYGLIALVKDNPGTKSELFRRHFIETVEQILACYMTAANVCNNALSILYILIEEDPRQKYSTQSTRQAILHSNLMNILLDILQKTDNEDLKKTVQTVLNLISKDLS